MATNNYHISDVVTNYNDNGHSNGYNTSSARYELKSEEVQDIMSKMPHWIIRRGISVLFAVMILLFAGAYFIHYPDVIITNISITSSDPPVKLVAPTNG